MITSNSCKNHTHYIYICEEDLACDNLDGLICRNTELTKETNIESLFKERDSEVGFKKIEMKNKCSVKFIQMSLFIKQTYSRELLVSLWLVGWLVVFYSISNFVCYITTIPFLFNQFNFKNLVLHEYTV